MRGNRQFFKTTGAVVRTRCMAALLVAAVWLQASLGVLGFSSAWAKSASAPMALASVTSPMVPASGAAASTTDPLLDDTLLQEPDSAEVPISGAFSDDALPLNIVPTKNGKPAYPSLLAIRQINTHNAPLVLHTAAQLHRWVEDALNTAVAQKLPMDVTTVEAYRLSGQSAIRKAKVAYQQGNVSEGAYYGEQGLQAYADALRLAMPSAAIEARAIWLDRKSIVNTGSPEGLRKLVRQLASTGINVIYLETINAGYPIYPSELLPQNPLIQGWDPLAVAVDEAHKQGIELHAWVWAFAVGNTRHNPLVDQPYEYPGPILTKLGVENVALKMANGSIMPPRQTEYWLSPGNPEARAFLKTLYKEIVTRYEVDGLQLDYIRYPFQFGAGQAGYDAASRKAYAQAMGQTMPGSPTPSFIQWKTAQVTQFVKETSTELKAIRKGLVLSAAVFPMARARRLQAIQQDWETWVAHGWIDTLSPMIYTTSPKLFEATVASVVRGTQGKVPVYPGVAAFRLDSLQLVNHLQQANEGGSAGVTLFANTHVDSEKQAVLKSGPYKPGVLLQPHRAVASKLSPIVSQRVALMLSVLQGATLATDSARYETLKTLLLNIQAQLEQGRGVSSVTMAQLQTQLQPWFFNGQKPYQAALLAQLYQDLLRANQFCRPDASIQVAAQPAVL
ncbi:MAG: family 10 glycosylhydrolase [Vampirovibrionales bacterium]